MLIVLEGLDGAGKSTQVRMFREYLEERCPGLNYIHFPRYDSPVYGNLISRFLRGDFGAIDTVHPQLVALLFAEDRHGAGDGMRKTINMGGTVLLDRYVYSNIAYQCAKLEGESGKEELRKWILDTEYGEFKLPQPDLNIFLDVPVGFVEKSLASHRDGNDRNYLDGGQDIHEADINFQIRVRDMYRRQAALDPNFMTVDCSDSDGNMLPPESIHKKIVETYETKLSSQ